jgi:phosphate transport system permease protein
MTSLDASVATIEGRAVARHIEGRKPHIAGIVFQLALLLCLLTCLLFIIVLLADVLQGGASVFTERGGDFISSGLSSSPSRAGVVQGIIGSLMIAAFVVIIAFPLGIATAVYLEEYAADNWLTRFVTLNIRNLAGVPSVVYGLLGLTVFVELLGTDMSGGGITGGRSVIAGGLTMAILVLPIVIITSAEAIRAVPQSLREGGYGVGATQWDVTRTLVLPNAMPGVLTGTVLALSRALGETAPLILVGAVLSTFYNTPNQGFIEYFTAPNQNFIDQLQGSYTALPVIIFNWAGEAKSEFKEELASAAILVLLMITFLCNAVAVFLRNRYDKTW